MICMISEGVTRRQGGKGRGSQAKQCYEEYRLKITTPYSIWHATHPVIFNVIGCHD